MRQLPAGFLHPGNSSQARPQMSPATYVNSPPLNSQHSPASNATPIPHRQLRPTEPAINTGSATPPKQLPAAPTLTLPRTTSPITSSHQPPQPISTLPGSPITIRL
jgi:hypothetical protein